MFFSLWHIDRFIASIYFQSCKVFQWWTCLLMYFILLNNNMFFCSTSRCPPLCAWVSRSTSQSCRLCSAWCRRRTSSWTLLNSGLRRITTCLSRNSAWRSAPLSHAPIIYVVFHNIVNNRGPGNTNNKKQSCTQNQIFCWNDESRAARQVQSYLHSW